MHNVSFNGRIEIRHFKNGVMSIKHIIKTTKENDKQIYNDIRSKFSDSPIQSGADKDSVMNYLKCMVEDLTGKKLPTIESKERYFAFLPKSLMFQEGVAKDAGKGDAYSVYILT